jgi:hypothetical protein
MSRSRPVTDGEIGDHRTHGMTEREWLPLHGYGRAHAIGARSGNMSTNSILRRLDSGGPPREVSRRDGPGAPGLSILSVDNQPSTPMEPAATCPGANPPASGRRITSSGPRSLRAGFLTGGRPLPCAGGAQGRAGEALVNSRPTSWIMISPVVWRPGTVEENVTVANGGLVCVSCTAILRRARWSPKSQAQRSS